MIRPASATSLAAPGRWGSRHVVVALCFLAVVVGYTDRVNLAVASVAMREQLGWSQTTKGFVLSAFFVGYMLFMPVAGWLSTRYGGKRVLGFAVLAWSAFTLTTPAAAKCSLTALIAARVGMGIGEAAMFPAAFQLLGRWIPSAERTRSVVQVLSGIPVGTVIGLISAGWIVSRYGWPYAFYGFGAMGLIWTAIWFQRVRDDPANDTHTSVRERELLSPSGGSARDAGPVPWRMLLSKPAVWVIFFNHFCSNWALYFFLSWLPSYFREAQGLSITNAGLFSAAPWLTMALTTNLAGAVADALIKRGVDITRTRKIMQTIGLIGPAALLLVLPDVSSAGAALVLICGAMGALGYTWAGYAPNAIDIAPRHAAAIIGISNTFGTIPGIVGVALTGWLVDATGTYSAAFVLTAAVSVLGAVTYFLLASAQPLVE